MSYFEPTLVHGNGYIEFLKPTRICGTINGSPKMHKNPKMYETQRNIICSSYDAFDLGNNSVFEKFQIIILRV